MSHSQPPVRGGVVCADVMRHAASELDPLDNEVGQLMWIGDQFAKNRAEQLGLLDIAKIFSPTPETALLERPTNHLLLGAKGSGKSTLLRALTWPVWQVRPSTHPPQFVGIYLPISYEEASHFRSAYDELLSGVLFEHFFVTSLLFQAAKQLQEAGFPEDVIKTILLEYIDESERENIRDLSALALRFLKERDRCLSIAKNKPDLEPSELDLMTREPLGISKLQYLAVLARISSDSCELSDSAKRLSGFRQSVKHFVSCQVY